MQAKRLSRPEEPLAHSHGPAPAFSAQPKRHLSQALKGVPARDLNCPPAKLQQAGQLPPSFTQTLFKRERDDAQAGEPSLTRSPVQEELALIQTAKHADLLQSTEGPSGLPAVAAEKVQSPNIARQKHIKTMTQLIGSSLVPSARATPTIQLTISPSYVQGRNSNGLIENQRLFKRKQELPTHQTTDDKAAKAKEAPFSPQIFKTMSSLMPEQVQTMKRQTYKTINSAEIFSRPPGANFPQQQRQLPLVSEETRITEIKKQLTRQGSDVLSQPRLLTETQATNAQRPNHSLSLAEQILSKKQKSTYPSSTSNEDAQHRTSSQATLSHSNDPPVAQIPGHKKSMVQPLTSLLQLTSSTVQSQQSKPWTEAHALSSIKVIPLRSHNSSNEAFEKRRQKDIELHLETLGTQQTKPETAAEELKNLHFTQQRDSANFSIIANHASRSTRSKRDLLSSTKKPISGSTTQTRKAKQASRENMGSPNLPEATPQKSHSQTKQPVILHQPSLPLHNRTPLPLLGLAGEGDHLVLPRSSTIVQKQNKLQQLLTGATKDSLSGERLYPRSTLPPKMTKKNTTPKPTARSELKGSTEAKTVVEARTTKGKESQGSSGQSSRKLKSDQRKQQPVDHGSLCKQKSKNSVFVLTRTQQQQNSGRPYQTEISQQIEVRPWVKYSPRGHIRRATGSHKEIKCVVTKQTKFGEERELMERLNQQTQQAFNQAADPDISQLSSNAENSKDYHSLPKHLHQGFFKANSSSPGINSLSKLNRNKNHITKSQSNVQMASYPPPQPRQAAQAGGELPLQSKTKAKVTPKKKQTLNQFSPQKPKCVNSAEKKVDKVPKQIFQRKFQRELLAVFDSTRGSKHRLDILNQHRCSTMSESGLHHTHRSVMKPFEDKMQSPVLRSSQCTKKTAAAQFLPNQRKSIRKLTRQSKQLLNDYSTHQNSHQESIHTQKSHLLKGTPIQKSEGSLQFASVMKFKHCSQTLIEPSSAHTMVRAIDTERDNQMTLKSDSNNESQLSAPQEKSSASKCSERSGRETRLIVPQSVTKTTKEKLSRIEFSFQLDRAHGQPRNSRNFDQPSASRFSIQHTKPALPQLLTSSKVLASVSPSNRKGGFLTQGEVKPESQTVESTAKYTRTVVFSDSHSVEKPQINKIFFKQPMKPSGHMKSKATKIPAKGEFSPANPRQSTHQTTSMFQSKNALESPAQPDTIDGGKQVPQEGLREDILARKRRQNSVLDFAPRVKLSARQSHTQAAVLPDSSRSQQEQAKQDPTPPLPSASQQNNHTTISNNGGKKKHMTLLGYEIPRQENNPYLSTERDKTFEGLLSDRSPSDSQFGDIADEENYRVGTSKDVHAARGESSSQGGENIDDTVVVNHRPTVNLSGKYTSCKNRNETLSSFNQQRVGTIRGVLGQAETVTGNALPGETAKEILLKKGSKCRCANTCDSSRNEGRLTCGTFCKHLSGNQQKKIIKKLMLEHFKLTVEFALRNNQKLTIQTSHNPFINQGDFGCLGDRKFLVSAQWWQKWCDYVNFTADEHGMAFPKGSFRDEFIQDTSEENDYESPFVGIQVADMDINEQQQQIHKMLRLSLYQQSSMATLTEAIENEHEQSQLFYERPGLIENRVLMDEDSGYKTLLKQALVEHFDFEVLPHSVWQHLYSWYSADVTVCRKLVMDPISNARAPNSQSNSYRGRDPRLLMSSSSNGGGLLADSSRHQLIGVHLEMFPSQQKRLQGFENGQGGRGQKANGDLNGRLIQFLSEEDEVNSNDTTQLLYKQQIEDYSSLMNQIETPDPIQTRMGLKDTPDKRGVDDRHAIFTGSNYRTRQRSLLNQACRNTIGLTSEDCSSPQLTFK